MRQAHKFRPVHWASILYVLVCCSPNLPAYGLQLTVDYTLQADDEGFDHPIFGSECRAAFEHAVSIWANHLDGTVPLVIKTRFIDLESNVLGNTPPPQAWANVSGLEPFFWYVASLASELRGVSMPSGPTHQFPNCHIFVEFNEDFNNVSSGSGRWYYGTDGLIPEDDNDFLGVALHEIAHSLGFFSRINPITGENFPSDMPFWMLNFVVRRGTTNLFFDDMSDAGRLDAITSEEVYFSGPAIIAAGIPQPLVVPDPNNPPVNVMGEAKLHAPFVYDSGSSISHWDQWLFPDTRPLLMAPAISGPVLNIDYTKEMLTDLGWTFQTAPQIQVSPGGLSFPGKGIGAGPTAAETVTITNIGAVTLNIIGIALENQILTTDADQFQITNSIAPSTIAPLQTRDITVTFDPDSVGTKQAYLRIFSNDTHEWVERVPLFGFAFDGTASAAWVDFKYENEELGTQTSPFNTLAEGVEFVVAGGTVNIRPGTTSETPILNKAMTLENIGTGARGGEPEIVRIGDTSARAVGTRNVGLNRVGFISVPIQAESKKSEEKQDK